MPRRSAASLTTPSAALTRPRLEPPDCLTVDQALRWTLITETKPADWFTDDACGLLTELVRAESEAARIAEELATFQAVDFRTTVGMSRYTQLAKAADLWSKAQVNLCRALRLTPHSRISAKTAGSTKAGSSGRKPWEIHRPLDGADDE